MAAGRARWANQPAAPADSEGVELGGARLQTRPQIKEEADFRNKELPMARVKKIMKTDDNVKSMVSAP